MFDWSLSKTLLALIPGLPLLAAVLTAALGRSVLRRAAHWPTVLALAGSLVLSTVLLFHVAGQMERAPGQSPHGSAGEEPTAAHVIPDEAFPLHTYWTWAAIHGAAPPAAGELPSAAGTGDFRVDVTLRADPLTCIMLVMVTLISTLVAVYSVGYMHGDPGYWRFFAYIGLFVFSMTMLVSVSNFILLYVFWEAVGLCSYLLIGFWYTRPEPAAAGMKAFLVNRVGDFGFALGVFLIWTTYGTLDFHDTVAPGGEGICAGVLGSTRLQSPALLAGGGTATAIGLLLMLGACGKSAQFPLHVWLPDAMEGPTPVSALIHAATMVTAGVYMVVRCSPLFAASPGALQAVAILGGFTAVLASLIALTQTDLKRILAYSTVSQLGFMFLAAGTGTLLGAVAAMFHLFTHAFFKALLFLGAGSVMHAMGGVIDIRRFGGLRRILPRTHGTFLCGALALAGVIPFAGFWSKDLVLVAVRQRGGEPLFEMLYWAATGTAALTAFYTFRAYFLTFWGERRVPHEAGPHAHESPGAMTWPLMALAVGAVGVGAYFEGTHQFAHFLQATPQVAYLARHAPAEGLAPVSTLGVAAMGTAAALLGIALAAFFYLGRRPVARRVAEALDLVGLYRLSHGKFFIDEIYDGLVVRPLRGLARGAAVFDRYAIDGLVNLVGLVPRVAGGMLRPLQGGLVPFYALAMVLGLLVLIGAMVF